MKAIICNKYGPPEVLQLAEVEKSTPKDNEVLIKIHATSVTASDTIVRGFKLPRWHPIGFLMGLVIGFKKPRKPILGMVFAGEIESIGKNVKQYKSGDKVFGWTIKSATSIQFGTYAEYKCLPEDSLIAIKPENISFEEAAAIPYGGLMALPYLKKGNIRNCRNVLIYGASGAIGTAAVQLANHFGVRVTGVCSTSNLEMVKSLGAETVIDYTKEDPADVNESFDLILDAVGKSKKSNFKLQCVKLLSPKGKYISVDDAAPKTTIEDLLLLKDLAETGHLKAVIDRSYPLEQMVEAHEYVDKGHKKGNVVIKIVSDGT